MNTATIAHSTLRRLRHPAAWAAIAAFALVWVLTRRLSDVSWERMGAWEFYVPALFLLGHLALAAAPWQWTGDARTAAPLWRGGLQALAWDAAWVCLLLGGVQGVVQPAQPNRPSCTRPLRPAPPPRESEETRPPEPPPRESWEERSAEPPPRDQGNAAPQGSESPPPPPPGLRQEMKLLFLNLPFALVMGWFLAGKERAESREEELVAKERQARALALQAQLHPHALYNVLGGLTELVHGDPDAAEQAIIGLVELLRMLTRQGNSLSLPLAQERSLLRRYLSIEAIRLGDRLQVHWDWPAWVDGIELPPLLLQPLVENAVKHGI